MKIKVFAWLLIYVLLAVAVFYICYVEKQRVLFVSLLAPLFVGLMGLAIMKVNQRFERGEIRLLSTFVIIFILVNFTFYIMECVFFNEGLGGFLLCAITFTVVYSGISWMRYKRGVR